MQAKRVSSAVFEKQQPLVAADPPLDYKPIDAKLDTLGHNRTSANIGNWQKQVQTTWGVLGRHLIRTTVASPDITGIGPPLEDRREACETIKQHIGNLLASKASDGTTRHHSSGPNTAHCRRTGT